MGIASLLLGEQNPFTQWTSQNQNLLNAIGSGLGQGQNIQSGLTAGLAQVPQAKQLDQQQAEKLKASKLAEQQLNATKNWLQSNHPDLAQMVDAGMPVQEAWQVAMQRMQPKTETPQNPFMSAGNGKFFNWQTGEYVNDPNAAPELPAPPAGYRYGQDGNLSFIPGGPADPSTAGKTTEATRRNQQLATVIVPELKSLLGDGTTPGTFDALASGWDQAKGMIPGGNMLGVTATSPQYQQAQDSLKTIVASYLYSVSGATANPGEVANQVDILTPKPGDSPERVAAKKDRIVQMVKAVEAAATGTPISIDGGGGGDAEIEGILSGLGI